jgi:arylformamidase
LIILACFEINRSSQVLTTIMHIIDLSHTIASGMPVYPGTEQAAIESKAGIENDGYNEFCLHISTHTGTHIDCERHFLKEGPDTGSSALDRFHGRALVIKCNRFNISDLITMATLLPYGDRIKQTDFLLFFTGWSKFWGTDQYYKEFPVPDDEVIGHITKLKLKGIGIDTPGFDPMASNHFPNHKILLSKGLILIENLTNLESLPESNFLFCCFPLKIKDGDGSPVRAAGIIGSKE